MSHTKAIHRKMPLALALFALAVAALWAAGANTAHAGGNGAVSLDPSAATVGEGGTTVVDVVATPPDQDLSIWIIEVGFDTDVVQVAELTGGEADCDGADLPNGGVGASICLGKDTDADQIDDAVVALGGYVRKEGSTAVGIDAETVLASINFEGVGEAGECSDLTITVTSWVGPDSSEPVPTVTNGEICITAGAAAIFGDLDCNGTIAARDNQGLLRNILSQAPLSQTEPCPDIGSTVTIDGTPRLWGDLDCNGSVAARDNQGLLRNILSQAVLSQTEPCPDIGSSVTVS